MKNLALVIVAVVALSGCNGGLSEASLVGKWEGKPVAAEGKADDPGQKLAEGMLGAFGGMNLDLKRDRTFHLQMLFIPVEGNWTLAGTTVTLTPTKVMGMPADQMKSKDGKADPNKPMLVQVSPDGKTLTMSGEKDQGDIQFSRAKA